MTANSQPYLPLGDIVLPQPDPTPQLVDEVMNRFGFERVQTAMRALGWTYYNETESRPLKRSAPRPAASWIRWPRRKKPSWSTRAVASAPAGILLARSR